MSHLRHPSTDRRPLLGAAAVTRRVAAAALVLVAPLAAASNARAAPSIAPAAPAAAVAVAAPAAELAPQARIVGGAPTTIREVPWQVRVWSRNGPLGGFDCGGAIVDALTVLTAAHCVDGADIGSAPGAGGLGVLAGVSHLDRTTVGDAAQHAVVVDARLHPQWSEETVQTAGDLAVLTLDSPLDLTGPAVRAVALPPDAPIGDEPVLIGQDVLVSGYGRQQVKLAPSGELFALESRVETPDLCFSDDNAAALCVRTPLGAACFGDSGGPLVTQTEPPVLVGIVSNGPEGCPAGEAENYVNLVVPENRRFVAGSDAPPIAPRVASGVTLEATGALVLVGQPVTCRVRFTNAATTKWKVFTDAGRTVASGTGGTSFSYTPTEADTGRTLRCSATGANAGGVAFAGPAAAGGPVLRALGGGDPPAPPTVTPFRLKDALLNASAPKVVRRGKLLTAKVVLTNLFAAADQATVCVRLGSAKAKCVAPAVKGQTGATVVFRFRIAKRAKVKSLVTLGVSAVLAGRNPGSGIVEQVNRASKLRARVRR